MSGTAIFTTAGFFDGSSANPQAANDLQAALLAAQTAVAGLTAQAATVAAATDTANTLLAQANAAAATATASVNTASANAIASVNSTATSATTQLNTAASGAATNASNAASSATAASGSATAAATSATNAASSATTASNQATNANNSATTAGTYATNASNSATAAASVAGTNTGRNKLVNPLFNVWQRGAGPFTTGYTADRWAVVTGSGGSRSISQVALTSTDAAQIGDDEAINGLRYQVTGGSGSADLDILVQNIENVRRLSGRTVTLSFWAKGSVAGLKVASELVQNFGSGTNGISVPVTGIGSRAFLLSTVWQRFTTTITVPGAANQSFGNTPGTDYTTLNLWLSAGSSFASRAASIGVQSGAATFWGVQLEPGGVATALEKRSPRHELAECQRSYATLNVGALGYAAASGAFVGGTVTWPATMRAAPTVTFGTATQGVLVSSAAFDTLTTTGGRLVVSASGAGGVLYSCPITLSADL